ncbi:MAG: hypothetical protein Kow0097_13800 [Candidatus Bipolaricaulota bacterium]|nr:VCBS repeat-containing protein [Candidatus Bipolaricaulota bacterium]
MRDNRRLGIVVAVALAVGAGGASPERLRLEFGGALPLWEPEGSPVVLLPGAVMQPPVDTPRAMVVADIDGDGINELIVGGDYLHVLSDGKITERYLTVFVGAEKRVGPGGAQLGVRAMAAGDMDGDGLTDLVVATYDGELWVLANHARWGFQWHPGSPYPVSGSPVWLFDHDGDGHLDVVLDGGSELLLLGNRGKGRLEKPVSITRPEGRLLAEALGRYAGKQGLFLLTDQGLWFLGQGEHAADQVLDHGGWGLAVGSFTGTDRDDVAISKYTEIRVYPAKEDGFGEPVVLQLNHSVDCLLAGDLNGDRIPDLVACAGSPAGFSVFYSRPGQGFLGPYEHGVELPVLRGLPPRAYLAAIGDLTGDGRDDLALALDFGHIAFFSAEPRRRSLQAIPGSFLLGTADLNGDGYPDLLTDAAAGGVAALVNSGWGTFTPQKLLGPSGEDRKPYRAKLGDVTGDGEEELVVWEFAEDSIPIPQKGKMPWEWPAEISKARITAWDLRKPEEPLWSTFTGAAVRPVLEVFDLNGDGIRDAVTVVGTKLLGLNFDLSQRHTPPTYGEIRVEVDMGGIVGPIGLLRLSQGERLAVLRLSERAELLLVAPGGDVEETGVSVALAPLDMIVVELNGDGNEDLVLIGWMAKEKELAMGVAVCWGDGQGGLEAELFPLEGWPPLALPFPYGGLAAADLDGDGKKELAAMRLPDQAGNPGGVVVIPWGEGGPGELEFLPGCAGTELLALDLDGDGRAELISVHTGIPAQLCITRWR